MRIVYLNYEKGWRGGERQTLLMAHGMAQRGHRVSVIVRAGQPLSQRLDPGKVRIIAARNRLHLLYYILRYRKYFDIWHAQTANTLTLLTVMRPFFKGTLAFTRRTAFPLFAPHQRFQWFSRWLTGKKWSTVQAFAAISQAAAEAPESLGFEPEIIPSAVEYVEVDQGRLQPIRALIPENAWVLGTCAALTREKDPLTLIQAVHVLYQKYPNLVFLHFGADGEVAEQARKEVNRLGLEQVFRFMGFNPHIEDVYRLFDGFVLSSRKEALGTSLLDAFMYEVPAVATAAGGIPSVVTEQRGWLCPVGDAQAIAAACEDILQRPERAQEKVQAAYRWVREAHGVEQMLDRYEQFYNQQRAPSLMDE